MALEALNSTTVRQTHQNGVDPTFVPDAQTITKATEATVPLLRGNMTVTATDVGTNVARDIELPELDKALNGNAEDLEKLIAYLMIDNEEHQLKVAQERLKSLLDQMNSEQQAVMRKLNEALNEAKAAEEAQKTKSILGWISMAFSVVACALTIALTCGAATPLAVAGCVLCCAATALTVTNQILTATGVADKHIEKRAEEMMKEDPKLTKREAEEKAQKEWSMGWGITQAVLGVASLCVGVASLAQSVKGLAKLTKEGADAAVKFSKAVQTGVSAASAGVQLASSGVGIASTVLSFDMAKLMKEQAETQAELKELQAFLEKIKAAIDEEEETLTNLLQQIQGGFNFIGELLSLEASSTQQILHNFQPAV